MTEGIWMQAITLKDGRRWRAFCLACLEEGRPWIGGELCEHFDHTKPVGPESKLDRPELSE